MSKNYRQDFVDREASMHESSESKNENLHHWENALSLESAGEKETRETRHTSYTRQWKPGVNHLATKSFKAAFQVSSGAETFNSLPWLPLTRGVMRALSQLCQAIRINDVAGF
jgi:hypothetical protein